MKTYKSYACGKVYKVGEGNQPSPVYIVDNKRELQELREYPQFEILPFDSREELNAFLEGEVLKKVRSGENVVAPKVEKVREKPKKDIFAPDKLDQDAANENRGRPVKKDDEEFFTKRNALESEFEPDTEGEEFQELRQEVREMEDKLSEAKAMGRTQKTIDKWAERLAEAKEALNKAEKQAKIR